MWLRVQTLRRAVRTLGLEEKAVKDHLLGGAVLFLATRLDYPPADYICSHPPFTQLFRFCFDRAPGAQAPPNPEPAKVGATFLTSEQALSTFIKVSEDFDEALKKWNDAVKNSSESPFSPGG